MLKCKKIMYKLLFENKYLLIEHSGDSDYYYISFTIAHFCFTINFNLGHISFIPYFALVNSFFNKQSWSHPNLECGFLFLYFSLSWNYKSNNIKDHFSYKQQKEKINKL